MHVPVIFKRIRDFLDFFFFFFFLRRAFSSRVSTSPCVAKQSRTEHHHNIDQSVEMTS